MEFRWRQAGQHFPQRLIDTIWPRRAHLELINFPGEELRVGRDAPPPTLRARALSWVIADSNRKRAPEGWRALMWSGTGSCVSLS